MKAAAFLVACLAIASPVLATPTEQEEKDHVNLIGLIEALNVPVEIDNDICKNNPGLYGRYQLNGSKMSLCSVGDQQERMNTLRHEAWHVYQDLSNCTVKDVAVLSPAFSKEAIPLLYKEHASKYYDDRVVATEAEAFWAADTFSALTMTNLIYQKASECGFKF